MPVRSRTLVATLALLLVAAAAAAGPGFGDAAAARGADPSSWTPAAWPTEASTPVAVEDARAALREAREAARRQRAGIEAEILIAPELDLLWRDDPPRPRQEDGALRPEASLTWSPLRSEALLADARVLEAELRLLDAWRRALLARWRAPVERARADAALRAAEADVHEAEADVDAAEADVRDVGARRTVASDDERRDAARALEDAELDLREARLDLEEARRDLAALPPPGDGPDAAERRVELALPATPSLRATRGYRARALRLAADVARSERRRLAAVLPDLGVEAGYAGADARIDGRLALRDGRPQARIRGVLEGTPQERAWLKAYLTLRLGDDRARATAAARAARRRELRAQAELHAAWRVEARQLRTEVEARRARWRLAEDRLAAARDRGDAQRSARAEEAARRAWLRYLDAVGKASTLFEALPGAPRGDAAR